MGFIIVMVVLALSGWAVFATVRHLRQTEAGRVWWLGFALLLSVGCGVGVWFASSFEYQASTEMRFAGFPVPLAFFHLEEGRWIDFITPPYVMYPGWVANVASFAAVMLLPLYFASRLTRKGRSQ